MKPVTNEWALLIAMAAVLDHGAVQKTEELAGLLELLAAERPARVVEIGVYQGGTLWAWSQLARQTIGVESGIGLLDEPLVPAGAQVLRADSHLLSTLDQLQQLLTGPLDFLFIDGDHTYPGVRWDWERYGPLVRPGGLIAFHDICHHQDPEMGVERLWGEIRTPDAVELVAEPTWWGGIGVLRA